MVASEVQRGGAKLERLCLLLDARYFIPNTVCIPGPDLEGEGQRRHVALALGNYSPQID